MVFNKFIYNKSKIDSIILIHGLFTNSGFWLNYFFYFKDYKIIVYNIDFYSFFDDSNSIILLDNECIQDFKNNRVVAVISHSYGSVVSDLIFSKSDALLFNICPITLGNRVNSDAFVLYLTNKLKLSENKIHDLLRKSDSFFSSNSSRFSFKGMNFIPNDDNFFKYELNMVDFIEIEGDHFEIKNAIIFIKNLLE
jgi:hypothetical protein